MRPWGSGRGDKYPDSDGEKCRLNPLKILVVDDTKTSAAILSALLEADGHVVSTASDGLEAIKAFLQDDPDLILMDVEMPNMNGIDAARHIREISEIIPIIFLSTRTEEALVE